ncbi:hypothetical protein BDV30DRAFT_209297 [Aspergillus minisclerotigenes]|uniref:Zn(2)-C6 fungal-type domain-containing protein n=1 Tax=Aspergillus minisclerotigenes TaxID=656917 RepID=A0A5N6J8R1_9EURO|nr:hypothetical protein BDV30DRAFT_209297 [Aspergillus minisclerotigenes]
MVFCGKPSKGCGECRSRKIRCDQARPTCSQCIKGNRVCPGYRDELSLMFRDESQQVVRKAKAGNAGRRAKKAPKSTRMLSPSGSSPQGTTTSSSLASDISDFNDLSDLYPSPPAAQQVTGPISPKIATPPSYQFTEDEAVCFFLRFNAWPGACWIMEFSPDFFVIPEVTLSQQAMKASLVAVGTAMLSRIRQDGPLKIAAEKEYGNALNLMYTAVMDEEEAKSNPTLGAVLLLAIFEVVTSRAPGNIEKWTNHIYGAAALLEVRGPEQLQDEDGLKLFVQLRFQIIICCLQRAMRVPDSLIDCSKVAMFLRTRADVYGDRLIGIAGRLSNLRADINMGLLVDPHEILSAAYGIEAELMGWIAALPPEFLYTNVEGPTLSDISSNMWGQGPHPYNNKYHVYNDLWTCHTFNQYRCARIIVSEIILTCLRQLSLNVPAAAISNDLLEHCTRLRNTTRQLANDICASVPYHFSVGNIPTGPFDSLPVNQSYVAGLLLLWPLVLAGATESLNHPLRKWVISCFRLIGHSMGVDQALALVEVLECESGIFDGVGDGDDGIYFRETVSLATNRVLVGTWAS